MAKTATEIVVVTGGTGYIASHIIKVLLEEGYTVRTTVRDPTNVKKNKFLKELPGASERLHFFKADLLVPGAFDEVMRGATHVIHTASPVPLHVCSDPYSQVVAPAVDGTKNVFDSIAKSASVRRVVLTSSIRAVFGFGCEKPPGYLYSEDDWNTTSTLANNQAYALSKTLAEQAAWEYARNQSQYTLVAVNPGMVFGPTLSSNDDGMSTELFRALMTGQPPVDLAWGMVDVRDAAKAHVAAVKNDQASGRYICTNETLSHLDIINLVRHKVRRWLWPFHAPKWSLVLGHRAHLTRHLLPYEDIVHNVGYPVHFDNRKILRDLMPGGFIPARQTFEEMYDQMVEFGLLKRGN